MLGPGRDAARILREIADILDIVPDEHKAGFRAMSTGITGHMDYTTPTEQPGMARPGQEGSTPCVPGPDTRGQRLGSQLTN